MKYVSLLLVTCFASCIMVHVNGVDNHYATLTKEQAATIKPFSVNDVDAERDQKNNLSLAEITAQDIKPCLDKHPYTLVYLWDVNCKGEHCKPLFYYELIEKKFRNKGLKVFMVSETYQYDLIKGNAERSAYDRDLYVLKDAVYGHKLQHSRRQFISELAPGRTEINGRYLVFKRNDLVYHGPGMSEEIMDSVIKRN